ncbi:FAD-dependent oxidoreductase [Nocardioides sp.]|uniref:NAD(P)/FAD-dependent oxidoreductase n=1 Tax=Nocardioides sp. TaxID=35761 RepID=UPI002616EF7F|nr:FAD-dependent oxidoreductase [Nocardioides sp.]
MSDLVIIGAGLTAATAIETLREQGFDAAITLVGAEPRPPYERPQLSKEMLAGKEFSLRHDEQWYADHQVTLRLDVAVTAIDRDLRTVTLADGSWLPYDQLLIATGASARIPDLPGVERALPLRTKEDADAILAGFKDASSLVTVGGGWIGLEVAAAARAAGLDVTVLEQAAKPLLTVLGDELADYVVGVHESHGVTIRTGVTVQGLSNDAVLTDAGEVPADLVVLGVGAVPNDALARAAGLEVGERGGIVTNDHLETADPRIFAAGDVALAEHLDYGPLRVEHWDNAIKQGRLAARAILGQHVHYDWQPYFYTDQFEFSMEYVGHSAPHDEVVIRGDLKASTFIAYWLAPLSEGGDASQRTVTAAMNVGIWDVNEQLRALVGTSVDPAELTDLQG